MSTSFDLTWAQRMVDTLHLAFNRVLSTETASPFALLTSPGGNVYKVTVSDGGTLATALMPKGKPL